LVTAPDSAFRDAEAASASASASASLRAERDLYRKLLDLGSKDDLEAFLHEALSLILQTSTATRGYLELRDETCPDERGLWWIATGLSDTDVAGTRAAISRGVVAEALATGRTIVSASALDDPRFDSRESVKANRIEAVLCAPIGTDPPFGVLYLQDRREPGPFSEDDRARAELFAHHLAPLADRLVLRRRERDAHDPTRPYRATLQLGAFAGRSDAIARLLRDIAAAAPRKIAILLTGASGTGKTYLARIIHTNSPRSRQPFVELSCATLPESLVESELFGAMPGAHSTATHRILGKVAAAEGGTLFLDEIDALPLGAQSKLLQLLQSLEYFPLGATKPERADVRIIAATNVDLKAAVERRTFREDLFYRLEIVPIRVPSLAARPEDIHDLVLLFVTRACEEHTLPLLSISGAAVRAAETADWPGNVRQLENSIEAAVIRATAEGATQIETRHVFPDEGSAEPEATTSFQAATRRFQGQLVLRILEETSWNVVEAARRLEVTRSHVYNLIRAHGLERVAKGTTTE
jgi:Nif-specific regulatory protein